MKSILSIGFLALSLLLLSCNNSKTEEDIEEINQKIADSLLYDALRDTLSQDKDSSIHR